MQSNSKKNILFLCNLPSGDNASTISDHIEAFQLYSGHQIWIYSILGEFPRQFDLEKFDVLVIHYSLSLLNNYYLTRKAKQKIREFPGLKVVFIQDEYRQINKILDVLNYLNVDILFTCFPEQEIRRVYSEEKLPHVSIYNNLTGYIPERLLNIKKLRPVKERPICVGYRARKVPFWYGELGFEKWNIVEKWKQHTSGSSIRMDISYHEKDRIYGENWHQFLMSCKTNLGVESGASVMDFTGELEKQVELHQLKNPKDHFYNVQKKYLLEYEGKYKLNQISPRCFEAIAMKTVLVLYEGEYSNIIQPWKHYIPLKKDFSNISEVLNCIQDDVFLQNMADRAYEEIATNFEYSYKYFISQVDSIINKEFISRSKKYVSNPYTLREYNQFLKKMRITGWLYRSGLSVFKKLPVNVRLVLKEILRV